MRLVQAFQYADKTGNVIPCGWTPEKPDDVMKPDVKGFKEYFKKHYWVVVSVNSISLFHLDTHHFRFGGYVVSCTTPMTFQAHYESSPDVGVYITLTNKYCLTAP